ncbi:hypothetical protein SSX86_028941 [Deinandra increscens subsp. villosa]|uniref:Bifunctional inhibitor/plant lipid transfer protein/seed storage helical domain-containing protein n=1 Tax=Deinandra increscens subsp. villosa TaxID=3103831 RepID=A0AAP0CEV5_9ASTR
MASRALAKTAFLFALNLLFFTLVTSTQTPKGCGCTPSPSPPKAPTKPPTPSVPSSPKAPIKPPTPSVPSSPKAPTPKAPTPSVPAPSTPLSPPKNTCPIDTLKLGACANVLNGLLNLVIGSTPKTECCSLIGGLADLDAAVCLCTAIKANVLGINLNVPVSLSLLLNYCDKKVPSGFQCA